MATALESLAEFRGFLAALRDAFEGRPWHEVAEKASRMWRRCGLEDRVPWELARHWVRNAFLDMSPAIHDARHRRSFEANDDLQRARSAGYPTSNTLH